MNRRLQCTTSQITLLFVMFYLTNASNNYGTKVSGNYLNVLGGNYGTNASRNNGPNDEVLPACSYEKSPSGELVTVNVSLQAPGIHTGNYESIIVTSPGRKVTRDVIVYWENFLQCNGVIQFHYKAFYMYKTINGRFRKQFTDFVYANHAIFTELRYDRAYDIEVVAIDKDAASDVSIIHVPSETDKTKPKRPSWLKKKQVGSNVYELSWENLGHQQSVQFLQSNKYTLYWCENEPNSLTQCNGKMYSVSVPTTESHRFVTVPDPTKDYQFGISAEKLTGNQVKFSVGSGITWETCMSLPDVRPEVIIIRKVWATVIGQTYVGLRWKIDCDTMTEFFSAYNIYYCPVVSYTNRKCKEKLSLKFHGRYSKNNSLPLTIIPDLQRGTTYLFSVDILTHINNNFGVVFRTAPLVLSTSWE